MSGPPLVVQARLPYYRISISSAETFPLAGLHDAATPPAQSSLPRLAAIPLLIIMLTAIIVTKIPILFGHGFGPFEVRELSQYGFWSMAHEMRTDWSMLLGSLFLLIAGAGPWSLDALLSRRSSENDSL